MRTRGMKKLAMTAGLMSFLCGTTYVLAEVPAALDRVPTNAQVVIAVRDLDAAHTKLHGLMDSVGIPFPPEGQAEVEKFIATPGLNFKGSLAVSIMLPKQGMGDHQPDIIVVMPVSDASAFIKAWGGEGTGVCEIKMFGHEEAGFAKDIGGGYVAIGKAKESVEKFDGKGGSKAAHAKALGVTGNRVADSADVILVANFPELKEEMEQGVAQMKDSMEGMAQMMGEGGEQLNAMMKLVTGVADAVIKDGQVGIVGVGIDAKGVNLDIAANFKEGSESAKKFDAKSHSGVMTAALPSGDFLFAGAVDWTSSSVQQMFQTANELNKAGPMAGLVDMSRFMALSNGYAGFIGAADLGAGLFANSGVVYTTNEPGKLQEAMKGMLLGMNDKTENGMTFKTEYKESAKEIAGSKAASFSLGFDLDANNPAAGQMQMVMPMIFGPEGKMQGYMLATDKAMITTLSRNSALLERMIASNKSGTGFATDPLVAQTIERLPADRFAEGYVGMKSVMDLAQGAMAMFGGPGAEIKLPEKLAPVGMGVAATNGGMQFRLHVPTDVIKATVDVTKQFRGGHGDDGAEPMNGGDEKPRF